MRDRWAALIPPLLCCLLADLCLVILPFRPHDEQPVILAVVVKGYSLQPQEQPKIGTPKELETIRAVLSRVPDRQER